MFHLTEYILSQSSYLFVFIATVGYFTLLYFGGSMVFLLSCKLMHSKKLLSKIIEVQPLPGQIKLEIRRSIQSIIVFGFSAIPLIYLIRNGLIHTLPNTLFNTIACVLILTVWNELHFYAIHRLMHTHFFMKHIHYVHHQSKIPTVFSVYSFHWFEAFLLSTVPLTLAPFVPLSPLAIAIYPLTSILLNLAGHCNFRFGKGEGEGWTHFATHHNQHHHKGRKNFGFAFNFLDKLLTINL